jgi:hypothetical protein
MATTTRRPRTELQKAEPEGASPLISTEQNGALVSLKKRIIDQELAIQQIRLYRRLSILWLVIGTPVLVGLMVAGNLLIDYSRPGTGRWALNFFGIPVTLVLTCLSAFSLFATHHDLQEQRGELSKLNEEKGLLSSHNTIGAAASQRKYKEEIHGFIEEYRREAKHNRRVHNSFYSVIIIGSIVTTSVTSAIGQQPAFKWLAVTISVTVGIAAGFTGYFKFRERSMNLRQTADAIEHEYNAAELGIRRYRGLGYEQGLALLAEEVEWLREEQRKREQQLEQPPEPRSTQAQ